MRRLPKGGLFFGGQVSRAGQLGEYLERCSRIDKLRTFGACLFQNH